MLIFCRRIIINKPQLLNKKGPLLLACNHPNSFLDAAILADLFRNPVYSLARGDVFKKPFYIKLLTSLKILPVYRTSEGVENLGINYQTFEACKEIFKKKGIVLIFSEAKCVNEWHLRPLKKGTARLAFTSWDEDLPADRQGVSLEVLPVGINYSSFRRFGKNVFINFGEIMTQYDFEMDHADGKRNQTFNNKLEAQLQQLVLEIDKNDIQKQKELLKVKFPTFIKIILFLPGLIGLLIHAPLYLPIKNFVHRRTKNNDHFDSVLVAILLFLYPLYVAIITIAAILLSHNPYFLLLIFVIPFTAWSYVQLKPQLDK
jgi:1-acyl-sn-glycerol-3-phosphate acyltransferase